MEEYKGKKVHLDKFKWEETKGNDSSIKKFFYYEGYVSDEDVPHGTGKMTEESRDYVREGEWENGEFVKGTYSTPYTQRYLGSFRSSALAISKSQTFQDSELHGDGEEYHYDSKENYINNKPSGYVKGLFNHGSLIEGEILNASLINYTEEKGVKKIIYNKRVGDSKTKDGLNNQMREGKIFYEVLPNIDSNRPEGQAIEYEGEIDFDLPHGKGTMTFEDGSKRSAIWYQGETEWT